VNDLGQAGGKCAHFLINEVDRPGGPEFYIAGVWALTPITPHRENDGSREIKLGTGLTNDKTGV
jgi:hypothetical protein